MRSTQGKGAARRQSGGPAPSPPLPPPPNPAILESRDLAPAAYQPTAAGTSYELPECTMPQLATYLSFFGNAREVLEHYHDVFGGDLDITTYGDMPMPDMPFEPDPQSVAHGVLTMPGGTIAGGDMPPGGDYAVRDTIYSMLYTVDSVDDARRMIDQMVSAGGEIGMPFEEAPWGGYYGQVFDKYGVMWAFGVPGSASSNA